MTATNSYYELTQDQTVNNQKTYYTYSNGSYTEVENPKDADIGSYYELKTGYNVDIKRYNGTDWQRLYPRTDWSNIENKPTNFTPSSHNHDSTYLKLTGGDLTGAITIKKDVAELLNLKQEGSGAAYIRLYNNNQTTNYWRFGMAGGNNFKFYYNGTNVARIDTNGDIYSGSTKVSLEGHTHSYLPLSGGTITATSGDAPLAIKSSTGNSWVRFLNSSGSTLGYLGVNSSKQPVFYDTESKRLALLSDIGNATLTIQAEGTAIDSFSANATSDKTINITASALGLTSALKYIGETTSDIADGSTTQTVVIDSNNVTAASGNVVTKGGKEFLWKGSSWEELGDESSHALKSITITGTGALGGGGSLEQNRTITHNAGNAANLAQKLYKISTDAYSHVNAATEVTAADIPNLSSYYLPLTGGDLTGAISITKNEANLISLYRTTNSGGAFIKFFNNNQTTNNWRTGMSSNNNFEFLYNENLVARVTTTGDIYSGSNKVSVEGHTHSYLPLSGGTLTGAITLTEQSSIWNDNNIKGNAQGSTIGFNTSGQIGFAANLNNQALDAFTFRINGTNYIRISKYDLRPETTATYDLGTTVKNFNNIYGTTIYEGNTSLAEKYLQINDVYEWAKASTKPSYNFSEINNRYDTLLTFSGDAPAKTGSVSPIGMTLSDELSANRLAFISASALTFEYSTDGSSWPSLSVSDATKRMLFTQHGVNIPVGRNSNDSEYTIDSSTRITITATSSAGTQYFYCSPKKLLINVSTSAAMQVLVEVRTGTNYKNNGSWARYGVYQLSGWSGWNEIPFVVDTLGGDASQTSNYWQLRLTFTMTTKNDNYPKVASVNAIRLYADNCWREPSNLAYNGHMYSYDVSQNVTFPAQVKATDMLPTTTDSYNCGNSSYQWNKIYGKTIYENGTPLAEKYLSLSGGTLNGSLQIFSTGSSWDEGIRIHPATNEWSGIVLCEKSNSGNTGTSAKTWSIHNNEGVFGMYKNGSDIENANIGFSHNGSNWILKGGNLQVGGSISEAGTALSSKYVQKIIELPVSTNLNTVLNSGFYRLQYDHGSGFPYNGYSQMIVSRGADTVTQIGLPYSRPDIYVRSGVIGSGDSFSANWKKVTNLGLNTDGYIELNADAKIIAKTTDNNSWDSAVYSSVGYKDNVYISFRPAQTNKYIMVGFTTNPGSSTGEGNIDYCWYCTGDGNRYIYNAGYAISNTGSYSAYDEFVIQYSYGQIKYYYNGELIRTQDRALGAALYMQVSLYNAGSIQDVTFGNIPSGIAMQNNSFTLGNGEESQFVYRTASGCEAGFYYQSTGDESVVFANEYAHAGWMFANGIRPTQTPGWQQIVTPIVHIKNSCLAINKQIAQGATPSVALDVVGRAEIYNSSSDTVLNLRSGSADYTYIEFKNSSNTTMGYLGINSSHRAEVVYESPASSWHSNKIMTNADFSVSGTTLTINIPS